MATHAKGPRTSFSSLTASTTQVCDHSTNSRMPCKNRLVDTLQLHSSRTSTSKLMMLRVGKTRQYIPLFLSQYLTSRSATGQYCDTLVSSWLSDTNWTKEMDCHDCILGTMQTQLKSPLDYTEEYAEDFASLTSSCGSTQYAFTTAAPYALSTRTKDAPIPTIICTATYTVNSGDTCNTISEAKQVSTYGITYRNGLYSDCSNLAVKSSICVPDKCTTYKVRSNDTCDGIIEQSGNAISGSQFLAWNPNINALCSNLGDLIDKYICLRYASSM